jgi:hypothetical protein
MDENAASRVLVLLGRGTIRFGEQNDGLPPLQVSNAGRPDEIGSRIKHRLFP